MDNRTTSNRPVVMDLGPFPIAQGDNFTYLLIDNVTDIDGDELALLLR